MCRQAFHRHISLTLVNCVQSCVLAVNSSVHFPCVAMGTSKTCIGIIEQGSWWRHHQHGTRKSNNALSTFLCQRTIENNRAWTLSTTVRPIREVFRWGHLCQWGHSDLRGISTHFEKILGSGKRKWRGIFPMGLKKNYIGFNHFLFYPGLNKKVLAFHSLFND